MDTEHLMSGLWLIPLMQQGQGNLLAKAHIKSLPAGGYRDTSSSTTPRSLMHRFFLRNAKTFGLSLSTSLSEESPAQLEIKEEEKRSPGCQ